MCCNLFTRSLDGFENWIFFKKFGWKSRDMLPLTLENHCNLQNFMKCLNLTFYPYQPRYCFNKICNTFKKVKSCCFFLVGKGMEGASGCVYGGVEGGGTHSTTMIYRCTVLTVTVASSYREKYITTAGHCDHSGLNYKA